MKIRVSELSEKVWIFNLMVSSLHACRLQLTSLWRGIKKGLGKMFIFQEVGQFSHNFWCTKRQNFPSNFKTSLKTLIFPMNLTPFSHHGGIVGKWGNLGSSFPENVGVSRKILEFGGKFYLGKLGQLPRK